MGYAVKVQKISRQKSTSYYAHIPNAVVESLSIAKGEQMEWLVEDRNTLVLRRVTLKCSPKTGQGLSLNQIVTEEEKAHVQKTTHIQFRIQSQGGPGGSEGTRNA
jgi:antitoxin component of MazEF toxin-antitoxin module